MVKWGVLFGIALLGIYVISSNFNLFGNYRPFLVQSGSMEPAIMTGDVIVIQNKGTYLINDVVTFENNAGRVVTHRIVTVESGQEKKYSTKGDANRTGDEDIITDKQILGRVALVIPKLGYLVAFAKSRLGVMLLIITPAIIFIFDELLKIKKYGKSKN